MEQRKLAFKSRNAFDNRAVQLRRFDSARQFFASLSCFGQAFIFFLQMPDFDSIIAQYVGDFNNYVTDSMKKKTDIFFQTS